jgi:hypothetical protein
MYSLHPELTDLGSIQFTFYIKDLPLTDLLEISYSIQNSSVSSIALGTWWSRRPATSLTLVRRPRCAEGVRPCSFPLARAAHVHLLEPSLSTSLSFIAAPPVLGEGVRSAPESPLLSTSSLLSNALPLLGEGIRSTAEAHPYPPLASVSPKKKEATAPASTLGVGALHPHPGLWSLPELCIRVLCVLAEATAST